MFKWFDCYNAWSLLERCAHVQILLDVPSAEPYIRCTEKIASNPAITQQPTQPATPQKHVDARAGASIDPCVMSTCQVSVRHSYEEECTQPEAISHASALVMASSASFDSRIIQMHCLLSSMASLSQ